MCKRMSFCGVVEKITSLPKDTQNDVLLVLTVQKIYLKLGNIKLDYKCL